MTNTQSSDNFARQEAAALNDNLDAIKELGMIYFKGVEKRPDALNYTNYYETAFDVASPIGLYAIGHYIENNEAWPLDKSLALECYKASMSKGCTQAIVGIAHCYEYGLYGLEQDYQKAFDMYWKARYKGSDLVYPYFLNLQLHSEELIFGPSNYIDFINECAKTDENFKYLIEAFTARGYGIPQLEQFRILNKCHGLARKLAVIEMYMSLNNWGGFDEAYHYAFAMAADLADEDPTFNYYLGKIFQNDQWSGYNPSKAIEYYKEGVEHGSRLCQCILAKTYLEGIGLPMDVQYGLKLTKKFAEDGNWRCLNKLGYYHYMGYYQYLDRELGLRLLKKAARHFNATTALYNLASIYFHTGEYDKASVYADRFITCGEYSLYYDELAIMSLEIDRKIDIENYYDLLKAGPWIDNSNLKAYFLFHQNVLRSFNTEIRQQAFQELKYMAEHSVIYAKYYLALCYESGLGVTANKEKAFTYMHEAADLNLAEAIYKLALFYEHGYYTKKDNRAALELYVQLKFTTMYKHDTVAKRIEIINNSNCY